MGRCLTGNWSCDAAIEDITRSHREIHVLQVSRFECDQWNRGCPGCDGWFPRPLIVVAAKRVERALLPRQIERRGPRGLRFQGAVHPFMRAVLLWRGQPDPLMLNPEPQPPHVQPRQAVQSDIRERHAVVRPNRQRQVVTNGAARA